MLKEEACTLNIPGTATRTIPLLKVPPVGFGEKMTIEAATFVQELATDGAKLIKIRNRTKARDLTADLTINGLGAQAAASFVLSTTKLNRDVEPGDQLEAVYTVNTAGTVAPGDCTCYLRFRTGFTGEIGG